MSDIVYTTSAMSAETKKELRRVKEEMRRVDRRLSTDDAVISELIKVYDFNRSRNIDLEDPRDGFNQRE